jgi:hypothetical protein
MSERIQGFILAVVLFGIGCGMTYFASLPVRACISSVRTSWRSGSARTRLSSVATWLFPLGVGIAIGSFGLMLISFGGLLALSTLF